MNLKDEIIVNIEKLAFGGEGIARHEGFVIFVENSIPNDKLKIKITSLNKHFARAKILEIITPSPNRTKPFCPMYNSCGSCQGQNIDYDFLVEQKQIILKDIFPKYNIPSLIKSPKTLQYRNKIQYPCTQTKNSKRILLGYYKNNSHDITDIKYCPTAPELMNNISQYIRENFPFSCYVEKTKKGLLRHIVARFSTKGDVLITFVLNTNKFEDNIFYQNLADTFSQIKGIFINFNTKNTNKILGEKTIKILGDDYIQENLENKKYLLGATSFFQVNPYCAVELFNKVKEKVKKNSTILDCYGGSGVIGIYLEAKAITLIEQNPESIKLARKNYELNNIKNYEIFKGNAEDYIDKFKNKQFDYVIIDPPRSGCDKKVLENIVKLSNKIIYISCNPQTLKRDIEYLEKFNFKTNEIQGIDLFPFTHHIECISEIKKEA